jgi:hypothetical protein
MESEANVLEKASQLSRVNTELLQEIGVLEGERDILDQHFQSNLSALNQLICELPVVVNVLLLKKPPVS